MSMLKVLNGNKVDGKIMGLICGESVTKQKVGIEHDINKLVAKYKKTGEMPNLSFNGNQITEEDEVVDLTQIGDFQMCQNKLAMANELFDRYPSLIRRRFNNSVVEYVMFMSDLKNPERLKEAIALGIVVKKEEEPKKEEQKKDEVK